MKRTEFPGLNYVRLEALSVNVPKTSSGVISVASGVCALGINLEGSVVVRSMASSRVVIVPARSMFFVRGPVRLSALVARGDHKLQVVSWQSNTLSALDLWLQTYGPGRNVKGLSRNLGCKPIDPHLHGLISRFEEAKAENGELTEPLLVSVVYEAVSRIMVGSDEMQLSPLPAELPKALTKLSVAVRKEPSGNWSLKEASEFASYSPFHFSRVFKQLVGYGFHEYVDRCRTELAVELLVSTDLPVDHIATQAGFGTTQGLRESVREYLGFVPSEFRSLPDVFEATGV